VHFRGRYLEVILYEPSVQMLPVTMTETTRFREAAAQHNDCSRKPPPLATSETGT
jgi:hypothetical protein